MAHAWHQAGSSGADLVVVESMSLTIGSGTWSTLARWCGRHLPYLRRSAARAYVAHQLRGGVQCDGGLDGQDLLFRPASLRNGATPS